MAAKLLEYFDGIEISLEKGAGGIFDVSVEEETVFSKLSVDDVTPEGVIEKIEEYKENAIRNLADAVEKKCR